MIETSGAEFCLSSYKMICYAVHDEEIANDGITSRHEKHEKEN